MIKQSYTWKFESKRRESIVVVGNKDETVEHLLSP